MTRCPASRSRSSRCCAKADDQDAFGWRGHGDRKDVHGEPDESDGIAGGGRPGRPGRLDEPSPYRVLAIFDALRAGMDIPEIFERTSIDPFFIASMARIVAAEGSVSVPFGVEDLRELKRIGLPTKPSRRLRGPRWRLSGA